MHVCFRVFQRACVYLSKPARLSVCVCVFMCIPASVSEMWKTGRLLRLASNILSIHESACGLKANIKVACSSVTS